MGHFVKTSKISKNSKNYKIQILELILEQKSTKYLN